MRKCFKVISILIIVAAISFSLCACDYFLPEGETKDKEITVPIVPLADAECLWADDNAVYVYFCEDNYIKEILADVRVAFPLIDIKNYYITSYNSDNGVMSGYLSLLLVLNDGTNRSDAISLLNSDSRVGYAYACGDVPFENVNTFRLEVSSHTAEVEGTVNIKPEGERKEYRSPIMFDRFIVSLKETEEKKYTPADFPQADIINAGQYEWLGKTYFELTLKTPGYFEVIKAVTAFASDPAFRVAETINIDYDMYDEKPEPGWKVYDISSGYDYPYELAENDDGSVDITFLKAGKVAVTYTRSIYTVSCQITVNEPAVFPQGVEYFRTSYTFNHGVVVIESKEQLDGYFETVLNINGWKEDILNAVAKYDEEYFQTNFLVFVVVGEGSGSIRHCVTGIRFNQEGTVINIQRLSPGIGTCDEAEWHILIPINRAGCISKDFTVDFTGQKDADLSEKYGLDVGIYIWNDYMPYEMSCMFCGGSYDFYNIGGIYYCSDCGKEYQAPERFSLCYVSVNAPLWSGPALKELLPSEDFSITAVITTENKAIQVNFVWIPGAGFRPQANFRLYGYYTAYVTVSVLGESQIFILDGQVESTH